MKYLTHIVLLSGLCLSAACLQIEVESQLMPVVAGIPDPGPAAPAIQLVLQGDGMHADDWVRALTISRFFYSGVENTSGTPEQLLQPGLAEVLRQRGYRLQAEPAKATTDLRFELEAERNVFLWMPPREFIQTPRPRARGTVRVDLIFHSRLLRGEAELWRETFRENQELVVLPGEEGPMLAQAIASAYRKYLSSVQVSLPAAPTTGQ